MYSFTNEEEVFVNKKKCFLWYKKWKLDNNKRVKSYLTKIKIFVIPAFECLYNIKLHSASKENLYLAAALTPIFDDFFDKKFFPLTFTKTLINYPDKSYNEKDVSCFIEGYRILLERVTNKYQIVKLLNEIIDYQQIYSSELTIESIVNQTFKKGGCALILYASILNLPICLKKEKLLFQLGGIFQLCDDIWDIDKDFMHKQITFAVMHKNSPFILLKALLTEIFKFRNEVKNFSLSVVQQFKLNTILLLLFIPTAIQLIYRYTIKKF